MFVFFTFDLLVQAEFEFFACAMKVRAFDGKVAREKIKKFNVRRGTILFFLDEETVAGMQDRFAPYAANFPGWALQASGMLQLSI